MVEITAFKIIALLFITAGLLGTICISIALIKTIIDLHRENKDNSS